MGKSRKRNYRSQVNASANDSHGDNKNGEPVKDNTLRPSAVAQFTPGFEVSKVVAAIPVTTKIEDISVEQENLHLPAEEPANAPTPLPVADEETPRPKNVVSSTEKGNLNELPEGIDEKDKTRTQLVTGDFLKDNQTDGSTEPPSAPAPVGQEDNVEKEAVMPLNGNELRSTMSFHSSGNENKETFLQSDALQDSYDNYTRTASTVVTSPERQAEVLDTSNKDMFYHDTNLADGASSEDTNSILLLCDKADHVLSAEEHEQRLENALGDDTEKLLVAELAAPTNLQQKVDAPVMPSSVVDQSLNSSSPVNISSSTTATTPNVAREIALRYKEEGNACLKQKRIEDAILAYTRGIEEDPTYHILYSNRSSVYITQRQFTAALEDADACIRLAPSFIKGYSHRATALLCLRKPLKALSTAQYALKLHREQNHPEEQATILKKTLEDAQRGVLELILHGTWVGTVDPQFGGYEQSFEFKTDIRELIYTVFDRAVKARYTLYPRAEPMAIDIATEASFCIEPYLAPPTVPYIFRLFYTSSETQQRKEYCIMEHSSNASWTELLAEDTLLTDSAYTWEMEMCAPFRDIARPTEFTGPGLVTMRKVSQQELKELIANRIDPELEALSFEEQLERYFQEILNIVPEQVLEEPSMNCDQEVAAAQVALFIQEQSRILGLSQRFPNTVSVVAEQLLREVPGHAQHSATDGEGCTERPVIEEAALSRECANLLHRAREHIEKTGLKHVQFSSLQEDGVGIRPIFSQAFVAPVSSQRTYTAGTVQEDASCGNALDCFSSPTIDNPSTSTVLQETKGTQEQAEETQESTYISKIASWLRNRTTASVIGTSLVLTVAVGSAAWFLVSSRHRFSTRRF